MCNLILEHALESHEDYSVYAFPEEDLKRFRQIESIDRYESAMQERFKENLKRAKVMRSKGNRRPIIVVDRRNQTI